MTTPDLHAIAVSVATDWARDRLDSWGLGLARDQLAVRWGTAVADAVLAAVLPAHRRQVLDRAIGALQRRANELADGDTRYHGFTYAVGLLTLHAQLPAGTAALRQAVCHPAPVPAQDGPPVVQEAAEGQRGAVPDDELRALADLTADEYGPLPHAIGDAARRELTARAERAEAERDEYVAEAEWHRLAAERHRLAAEQAEATIARYEPVIHAARKWRHPASGIRAEGMTDDEVRAALLNALAGAVDTLDGTEKPTRTTCCDMHNQHCEPPSELCCERCTECAHDTFPVAHADGSPCVLDEPAGDDA